MSWYNSKGEKAPDVVVITDARGRKGHTFNPWADESWRVENGFIYETRPAQTTDENEPMDRTAFNNACEQFRGVCRMIGNAIGDDNFRGGFDEMAIFQQSSAFDSLSGIQLAVAWSAANELCKYEGHKLGLEQPEWWYECWRDSGEE